MGKRVISEEERKRRVLYQRAYRAQHSQDDAWVRKERARTRVSKNKHINDNVLNILIFINMSMLYLAVASIYHLECFEFKYCILLVCNKFNTVFC
jgi:hypothetical protein